MNGLMYTTPVKLRARLESELRRAGFASAVCTRPRYTERRGYSSYAERECLEAGVFEYSTVRMPLETLKGYERTLRGLPGVVATRIVHEDKGTLRDQVIVTHLRTWDEPEERG
jgi:hypothetical protein